MRYLIRDVGLRIVLVAVLGTLLTTPVLTYVIGRLITGEVVRSQAARRSPAFFDGLAACEAQPDGWMMAIGDGMAVVGYTLAGEVCRQAGWTLSFVLNEPSGLVVTVFGAAVPNP